MSEAHMHGGWQYSPSVMTWTRLPESSALPSWRSVLDALELPTASLREFLAIHESAHAVVAAAHPFYVEEGGPVMRLRWVELAPSTVLLRRARLRRIRFHDLRHTAATFLLEQGVELVVIKELLGHAHIGVTATVYAHVRLHLQSDAINTLSTALDGSAGHDWTHDDGNDPPLCGAIVR